MFHLQFLLPHFSVHMQAYNYAMIDSCKLLTIFQVKFKLTNQSYSPLKISQSILNGALVIEERQIYQHLNEMKQQKHG